MRTQIWLNITMIISSVLDLAETFPKENCCRDDHGDANASYCRLQNIDEDTISKIIANLKNSTAKDIFGLDTSLLKEHKMTLTPVLKAVNQSINENNFPLGLKKSSQFSSQETSSVCYLLFYQSSPRSMRRWWQSS